MAAAGASGRPPTTVRVLFLLGTLLVLTRAGSGEPHRETPRAMVGAVGHYVAEDGDTLLRIAERNGLAIDHLCFANDWPAKATGIYPGTPVVLPQARVLPAPPPAGDGVVINLPERGLYLFRGGHFVAFFAISIGDSDACPTPTMATHIVDKAKNPVWVPPASLGIHKPVGPGPDNPLGDRWVGLGCGAYGIHSTNKSVNIGLSTTHGCIRLYPAAMRRFYEQVKVGMPVRIEYETAKIGRGADGRLYLVTFPDVYDRQAPVAAARAALHRLGLDAAWTPRLEAEARRTRGLPIPIQTAAAAI